jgi:hypothetical protein
MCLIPDGRGFTEQVGNDEEKTPSGAAVKGQPVEVKPVGERGTVCFRQRGRSLGVQKLSNEYVRAVSGELAYVGPPTNTRNGR